MSETSRLLVTCAKGLSPVVATELRDLGFPVLQEQAAVLETEGTRLQEMQLCLELRSALRVMRPLHRMRAYNPKDLYDALLKLEWESHFAADGYITIHGHVRSPAIRDERFAFQTVKDAIMDRLRSVYGRRPDSGPGDHGSSVYLHWIGEDIELSLDLAGSPLSRRGYRTQGGSAPMMESLAAGMLRLGGWPTEAPLLLPMCGSGTLAVEAALIARDQAPGLLRPHFAFKHLQDFDEEAWESLRSDARKRIRKDQVPSILASDLDPSALHFAEKNAVRAGVEEHIHFEQCDFRETELPSEQAWVALNPPYGQRLEAGEDLLPLYQDIGHWIRSLRGEGSALVISGNLPLSKRFGVKLAEKHTLFNGSLECRLLRFPLRA